MCIAKGKESYLSSIFSLMSGNRLIEACVLAAEHRDYRLALILAQSAGSNNAVRAMLKKQLKEWIISSVCLFFS